MPITMRDFAPAMGFLCEMLPMQRPMSDEALAMAWETLPVAAKVHLDSRVLTFAVKQRLVDPAPSREQALHIQLLRYVFPVERTVRRERGEEVNADRVILEGGLRSDLAERMAAGDQFHDPGPVRQEQRAAASMAPRLPSGGEAWHPGLMTAEARDRHLAGITAEVRRILKTSPARPRSPQELSQGLRWYARALQGFWTLQADSGGVAAAWIRENPAEAQRLLAEARGGGSGVIEPAGVVDEFAGCLK